MKKIIVALVVIISSVFVFAGCDTTPIVLEQANTTQVLSVRQDSLGDIYVETTSASNLNTTILVGYALGDATPTNWKQNHINTALLVFSEISSSVGSTLKFYTKLDSYETDGGATIYKESPLSAPYSYKVKNIYDIESDSYKAITSIAETRSSTGEMRRDIPQSGLVNSETNGWAYTTSGSEEMQFVNNIYYLSADGTALILKKLEVAKTGDDYNYTLSNPVVNYEYALVNANDTSEVVWQNYTSAGIVFGSAETIQLRIKANIDYCESPIFYNINASLL